MGRAEVWGLKLLDLRLILFWFAFGTWLASDTTAN